LAAVVGGFEHHPSCHLVLTPVVGGALAHRSELCHTGGVRCLTVVRDVAVLVLVLVLLIVTALVLNQVAPSWLDTPPPSTTTTTA
jgi:hypothetical protein